MKIAVFGWYGHNNAGDERIRYCLENFLLSLGGIQVVDFFDLHEHAIKGRTNQFDHYDLVIIGGGGLIFSQHNYHDFIIGLNTKVLTAGVSVETKLSGNPRKFTQALIEKSHAVLVRDNASYDAIAKLGDARKVKVSTDLTFLEPYQYKGIQQENIVGINLLSKLESSDLIVKIIKQINRLGFNIKPRTLSFETLIFSIDKKYKLLPIPLYTDILDSRNFHDNDIDFMKQYFSNVPNNFDDENIDLCKIFISMRLHGVIFAVQKGIIPLTLPIYPKQINFLKEVGIIENLINLNGDSFRYINVAIDSILRNERIIKEKMEEYCNKASCIAKKHILTYLN